MDRIVRWYRVSSSVGAVVALIAANAIPLVGVLFLGWSVWNILIIYWLENGVVGVYNVLKMARAEGASAMIGPMDVTLNGRPMREVSRIAMIPFFIVHYGIFWVVHGVFVVTLPFFTALVGQGGRGVPPFQESPFPAEPAIGVDIGTIVFAVVALAISHGLSYWWNFLRGGEYRRVSVGRQMFAPYGRLVVLHLTIIFGAMAVIATNAPVLAVAILVAIKIVLDLGFHLAEHRTLAGPAA